jgi:hypothetical protein
MGLTEREVWERAAASWNLKVENLSSSQRLQERIASGLQDRDCFYRFSAERFQSRENKWKLSAINRPLRRSTLESGEEIIESPLATALRPAYLPPRLLARIARLGGELERVLQLSNRYLLDNRALLSFFGSPLKGEFDWIESNAQLSPITQWLRVDYIWRWIAGRISLKVVDINLLPGMIFINERLARVCSDAFCEFGLVPQPDVVHVVDTSVLIRNILSHFRSTTGKDSDKLTLAVLMRPYHGLAAEGRACADALMKATGNRPNVVAPVVLQREMERIELDGVIRMSRPVSKHATGRSGEADNDAFVRSMAALSGKIGVFPSLNAYLENHSWMYIWRTEAFVKFAKQTGNMKALARLLPLLPRTSIIGPDGRIVDTNGTRMLTKTDLDNSVLKRGNSTGGQDLRIFFRPSSGQLSSAVNMIGSELDAGWVLQELVQPMKEIFPVHTMISPKSLSLVSGFMVHAAYYSNGAYLGGHAVMTPISRKVHGGFDSYLLPLSASL